MYLQHMLTCMPPGRFTALSIKKASWRDCKSSFHLLDLICNVGIYWQVYSTQGGKPLLYCSIGIDSLTHTLPQVPPNQHQNLESSLLRIEPQR